MGSSLNFLHPTLEGWDVSSFPTAVTAPFGRTPRRRPKALWKVQPSLEGSGRNGGWSPGEFWSSFHKEKPGGWGWMPCFVFFWWGDYCTFFSTWKISEFFLGEDWNIHPLENIGEEKNFRFNDWYCWWFRNPANQWILRISHFHRVSYITGGAGLFPSTVVICIDLCLAVLFDRVMRGLTGTTKFWGFEPGDLVATRVFFDNTSSNKIYDSEELITNDVVSGRDTPQ